MYIQAFLHKWNKSDVRELIEEKKPDKYRSMRCPSIFQWGKKKHTFGCQGFLYLFFFLKKKGGRFYEVYGHSTIKQKNDCFIIFVFI